MIKVEKKKKDTFQVTVDDGSTPSRHMVTLSDEYHRKLTGGSIGKEELIKRSFEFLLDREPNTSILSSFDLPVIQRYFPEYEDTLSAGKF